MPGARAAGNAQRAAEGEAGRGGRTAVPSRGRRAAASGGGAGAVPGARGGGPVQLPTAGPVRERVHPGLHARDDGEARRRGLLLRHAGSHAPFSPP